MTRHALAILALAAIACAALDAEARPGGGQGYSGGGGHSSGGGGGGGGDGIIFELLIRLVFYYPKIGVPLLLLAIVIVYLRLRHSDAERRERWSSGGPSGSFPAPVPARRVDLDKLRAADPEFSVVLFEDFLYALYARVHEARSDPAEMQRLAPYVEAPTRAALLAREPTGAAVSAVVVGAMRVVDIKFGDKVRVTLEFESNYTADVGRGAQGYYARERWIVERAAGVQTRPRDPAQAQEFRCPNCGAAFESTGDDRCRYCKQEVGEGRFDWTLAHVQLLEQQTRPPALTGDVPELGTDLPTVFDPKVQAQHAALIAEDPGAAPELIEQRLRAIYSQLNAAYTALELRPIRPLVSDAMFNYLQYWISAYRKQGLRNVLEQMRIERVQIVKLTRDRHYDAITLRFWASGIDYTIRTADRQRVSGDAKRRRSYSEYWTLIRGASVRGAPREPGTCPSCGAPTDRVNMAGTCEYCGSHLTRGEFDWVLSKIEQDDSYAG